MKTEKQHGVLNKFEQRLINEGKLKALLLSLTIGFAVAFVVAAISWFKGTNALLICLALVTGSALIGTPIFYLTIYRSSIKSKAKRIDRLGLEERTITMVGLENDDSIFARLLREDTRAQLEQIDVKQLKYRIPRRLVVWICTVAILGTAATTMCVLTVMGYMKSGAEVIDPLLPKPPVQYVHVEYIVEEGGYIKGEELQEIILGENGTEVFAVADEGWVFVGWNDGYERPDRTEFDVQSDITMVAVFEPAGADDELEDDDVGTEDPSGRPVRGENESSGDTPGDGTSTNGGGKYMMANQVINGKTYYREVLQQYVDMINEYLSSGEEIPDDVRKIIEGYLEIIG